MPLQNLSHILALHTLGVTTPDTLGVTRETPKV